MKITRQTSQKVSMRLSRVVRILCDCVERKNAAFIDKVQYYRQRVRENVIVVLQVKVIENQMIVIMIFKKL